MGWPCSNVNSTFQKTPSHRSLLESSLLKKAVLSPMNGLSPGGLSPLASSLSESEGNVSNDSNTSSKKKTVKSKCPCNATSGGKAWYLTCKNCGQAWHNLCANLRGSELTQRVIDSILPHWQCPWCYVSPYPRPKNHKSAKLANSLQSTTCANQISSQVIESLEVMVDRKLATLTGPTDKLVESIQTQLSV